MKGESFQEDKNDRVDFVELDQELQTMIENICRVN